MQKKHTAISRQPSAKTALQYRPSGGIMQTATKRAKAKKTAGKKTPAELTKVYDALCAILKPYQKKLKWKEYGDNFYYLETHDPVYRGKPMCYGGVRLGKNYVSYYLMSVYMSSELMKSMSPELKKRMQGKSCFNFTAVDAKLFSELKALTKAGSAFFDKMDWKKLEAELRTRK
jgi:hypothetical protein